MKSIRAALLCWSCLLLCFPALADHHVELRGVINVPGMQAALLQINGSTWLAHAGEHLSDNRKVDPLAIDILELDLTNEIVKVRVASEQHTATLNAPIRPETATTWIDLQNVEFKDVMNLYSDLSARTLLLHPDIPHDSFTHEVTWTNHIPTKAEINEYFANLLKERDSVAIEDGDAFLQIVRTATAPTVSLGSKGLPQATKASKGLIDFENTDIAEVIRIYGKLIGRSHTDSGPVAGTTVYFRSTRALSKEQTIYALETLITWAGNKIIVNNDNTFSVARDLRR